MTTARLPKKLKKAQQGFTLIELLVVIGILAVLLAIVLIAINPARQFAQANNTQRASNINAILNAIHEYAADNHGVLPGTLSATTCPAGAACDITNDPASPAAHKIDLCGANMLVTTYIADLPEDPTGGKKNYTSGDCFNPTPAGSVYDTDYTVSVSTSDQRITVTAPTFQSPATGPISVTR